MHLYKSPFNALDNMEDTFQYRETCAL